MNNTSIELLAKALEKTIEIINSSFGEEWLYTNFNIARYCTQKMNVSFSTIANERLSGLKQHDYTEICICFDGALAFETKNGYIKVDKGHSYIILPGEIHREIPIKDQDYTALWLATRISRARMHLSGAKNGAFFTSSGLFFNQNHEYNILLNNILIECQNDDPLHYIMAKTCLFQMYIMLLTQIRAGKSPVASHESWKESIVAKIEKYIINHGLGNNKLRDISNEVCLSENHMNKIFKSVTGYTITQYEENQRVAEAKLLLAYSDMTINEISSRLGYYDRYHFSKSFKKATGYSPGHFRKQFR